MEKIDPKGLNTEVRKWSRQSAAMMRSNVKQLTNKNKHKYLRAKKTQKSKLVTKDFKTQSTFAFQSFAVTNESSRLGGSLYDSIKQKTRSRFGVVERIIFPFAKHGIFIDLGVSRGHKKSNPRKKIDWYRFVFEERLDMLADVVSEKYADASLKAFGEDIGT